MSNLGITFGTDGWRARGDAFTMERVRAIGQAVATYLDDEGISGGVAIGYDARADSREAAEELATVADASGRSVTLAASDCPTPTLAWTVADGEFAGGLMVTASHNPPDYNGVKFVTADGSPALPATTDALGDRLEFPDIDSGSPSVEERSFPEQYMNHVLDQFDVDLDGLSVAYDAMHGSGREVTPRVLERAGATVERLRCTRDPAFGGVAPEPGPEYAAEIIARVEGDADIGFVNDGDADRVGIVTPDRGYLDPNVVLAVLYDYLLEDGSGDVVRSVPTSSLVDRVAHAAGQTVHETPVGFKWIAEAMKEHDTLVGGEESGGYGLTRHLPNKDGIAVALVAAAATLEHPLDARIDDLFDTHGAIHQGLANVECPNEQKASVVATLRDETPDQVGDRPVVSVSTADGVKLTFQDDSWLLIRPSGTEPKIRVYAESQSPDAVDALLEDGRALLE